MGADVCLWAPYIKNDLVLYSSTFGEASKYIMRIWHPTHWLLSWDQSVVPVLHLTVVFLSSDSYNNFYNSYSRKIFEDA